MEPVGPVVASHPVVAALARVDAELEDATALPTWSLDRDSLPVALHQLEALASRVAAVKLAVLAQAEAVQTHHDGGSSSTANWFAHLTRTTRRDAHAQTRLAMALAEDRPVRAALAAGEIRIEQAQAIVHAVDQLPEHVDPDLRRKAETHLLEQAQLYDAKALRLLGLRLLEVVAPEEADAEEAKKLEAEEKRAAEQTHLTLTEDGHGSVFVRAKIPAVHGAMLKKALLAIAAPKHQAATGRPAERRPTPQRLGQAFCELLESLRDRDLPAAGGTGATVVVTMTLDSLMGGLRAAGLDTGERISAAEARRLACTAGIIPAVLGGPSVPLDLGRTRRFHTRHQRMALGLRDGGCTADGCDNPPGLTQAHHDPSWSAGGPTDLDHARLFCPYHHRRAHDPTFEMTKLPGGKVAFHRRT